MRFLADESCDFAAVRALRAAGYDVVAVADATRGAEGPGRHRARAIPAKVTNSDLEVASEHSTGPMPFY